MVRVSYFVTSCSCSSYATYKSWFVHKLCGICEFICNKTILEIVNHFLYRLTDNDMDKIMLCIFLL